MNEPVWIDRRGLLLLHLESLAEHGGPSGIRDEGLLDSALSRPRNQYLYNPDADIPPQRTVSVWSRIMPSWMGTSASRSWRPHFSFASTDGGLPHSG